MNSYVQQIYNGAAMLMPDNAAEIAFSPVPFYKMERHMLRSTLWRIRVLLGEITVEPGENLDALAYMAGHEDESE